MDLDVRSFQSESGPGAHPETTLTIAPPFKIIGGGAGLDVVGGDPDYYQPNVLLTACNPITQYAWFAKGKDHRTPGLAYLTVLVQAIYDPTDEWDVVIRHETSDPAAHPSAVVTLPPGYIMTGGGAFVDWTGDGNLLTASFPSGDSSWEARSKDHEVSDPARITSYVIGIKNRDPRVVVEHIIQSATSSVEAHPKVDAPLDPGWTLSGAGARDNWTGAGNLLTTVLPLALGCRAKGKDHLESDPASLTAFVIGIRVKP